MMQMQVAKIRFADHSSILTNLTVLYGFAYAYASCLVQEQEQSKHRHDLGMGMVLSRQRQRAWRKLRRY